MSIRVARINVTPVKSLRLHHPEEVEPRPGWRTRGSEPARRRRAAALQRQADTSLVRVRELGCGRPRLAVTMPDGTSSRTRRCRTAPRSWRSTGESSRSSRHRPVGRCLSDLVGRSLTLVERDDGAWATTSAGTLVSYASSGSSTATAAGSRCCSSSTGSTRSARRPGEADASGGGGHAARRRAHTPLQHLVGQLGHGRPRPRRPPRADREARPGRRRGVP